MYKIYRQFPSCSKLLFQSEMILMKIVFIIMQMKLIIAKRCLNLVLLAWKVRAFGTRKLLVNETDFMPIKNLKKG